MKDPDMSRGARLAAHGAASTSLSLCSDRTLREHDRCYTITHLVNWLAVALHGYEPDERKAFVRACAQGMSPGDVPAAAAAVLVRHAPVAAVMGDFYRRFRQESRATPYPLEAIRRIEQRDGPSDAATGSAGGQRPGQSAAPRT
ncbi:hypothetical protein GCM10010340_48940 [Streptomyces griseoloalbus]|nr:hypothetical protein GCM10010340_48940 [Streptomyces albaduncus]